jgi:tRNA G18 (ribose-2'-O)-methylase SpoU
MTDDPGIILPARGYFGIGIYHGKTETNVGTLWRSAYQLGAAFVFTVGRRYTPQSSDTLKSWRHVPLYHYADFDDLRQHAPYSCPIIGVEMGGTRLHECWHPASCIYLLGAEDHGLPEDILAECQDVIGIESVRTESYNVAVAGAIVMYARLIARGGRNDRRYEHRQGVRRGPR